MTPDEVTLERPLPDLEALMRERKREDRERLRWTVSREGQEEPFIEGRGGIVYAWAEDRVALAVRPIEKAHGGRRRPALLDALSYDARFEKVEESETEGTYTTHLDNLDLACFLVRAEPENRSQRKYRQMLERLSQGLDPEQPEEEAAPETPGEGGESAAAAGPADPNVAENGAESHGDPEGPESADGPA